MKKVFVPICLFLLVSGANASSSPSFDAKAANALAVKSGCMSCHKQDKKVVGPSFNDIATRYAKESRPTSLAAKFIKEGGKGGWGPIPMPPNKKLTEAESLLLAELVTGTAAPASTPK